MKITAVNPATLDRIGEVECAGVSDAPAIIKRGRSATNYLRRAGTGKIKSIIRRIGDLILQDADNIARQITASTGKPIVEAYGAEIFPTLQAVDFLVSQVDGMHKPSVPGIGIFRFMGRKSYIFPKPVGVVLNITPWNFPFSISMTNSLFAIAAGCSVVLKPSEFTPMVGEVIRDIVARACSAEGIDEPLVQVVQGDAEVSRALIREKPDKVIFTGSTPTGKKVAVACAELLIPHVLELGGKNPAIILDDADVEFTVRGLTWGAFTNSGQVCSAIGRVLIPEDRYDDIVPRLIEYVEKLRQGDPTKIETDVGSLTTKPQFEKVKSKVEESRAAGGKVLCGGSVNSDFPGYFYRPTIIEAESESIPAACEELFGPVLPIGRYHTLESAIESVNTNPYGLHATVWSKNTARAFEIAKKISAGSVLVNDASYTYAIPAVPWGGLRDSGYGVTHSQYGLQEFLFPAHVNVTSPALGFTPWWFGYGQSKYDLIKEMTRRFYGKPQVGKYISSLPILKEILKAMRG